MSILILYASIEGHTGKIARFIETELSKSGHEVTLVDAEDPMVEVPYDGVEKVILAAPVHERRHPKPFEVLLSADRDILASLDTLFLSVSLKAAFDETREEAQDFADEMKLRTGLAPNVECLVPGAVQPASYDYYAEQILRHVILKGQDVDPQGARDFTDWDQLKAQVMRFVDAA